MQYSKYFQYAVILSLSIAALPACSGQKKAKVKAIASNGIHITMYKNPSCTCCSKWVSYMEERGYTFTVKPAENLSFINNEYGVPSDLLSCHIALVNGYVIEGHVPDRAIARLLKDRPGVRGLSVPGMQAGAPGVQQKGNGSFNVYAFDGHGRESVYGTYP